MNADELEKLLSLEESTLLEFKEKIDLKSDEGKGKFLKDILALVNSTPKQSYLLIGVEDKTKKPLGLASDITEERIQSIVSNYCRPPITLKFSVVDYHGTPIGVIQLFHRYSYHVLKVPYTYSVVEGKYTKQIEIRDKAVFLRRGSNIEEAAPDEIVEMGLSKTPDLSAILAPLDEIAYNSQQLHETLTPEPPNRYIETTFIAMITSLFLAWEWQSGSDQLLYLPGLVSFLLMIITSALRITHYGLTRSFFTCIVFWIVWIFSSVIYLLIPVVMKLSGQDIIFTSSINSPILWWSLVMLAGVASGTAAQYIINLLERRGRGFY